MTTSSDNDIKTALAHKRPVKLPTLEQMQKIQLVKQGKESPDVLAEYELDEVLQEEEQIDPKEQEINKAQEEANEIIIEAKRQAEEIIKNARVQAESERDIVRQELEQHNQDILQTEAQNIYQQCFDEAVIELNKSLEILDTAYDEAIVRLDNRVTNLFDDIEHYMLNVALQIAEKIMRIEFDRNDDVYKSMVIATLKAAAEQDDIVLWVSQWEMERFFERDSSFANRLKERASTFTVRLSPELSRSEFRIDAGGETIGAGISTQLERLGYVLNHLQ